MAPYIHDFAAFDLWLKPLGLLYVAAATRRGGYDVRAINCLDRLHPDLPERMRGGRGGTGKLPFEVIDKPECLAEVPRKYKRYGIPPDSFRRMLADGPRPDAVAVGSMMTYWCGGVRETIAIIRDVWPGAPIILGGVYATLCPEHARSFAGADFVVEGPGEKTFLEILRAQIGPAKGPPKEVAKGPTQNAESPESPDHAERAAAKPLLPAYDLLGELDSVSMLTSFGCPFSCAYCASRLLRPGFRQRPTGEVVDEITHYARAMGIGDIAFYDDALLINADVHIKPILRDVIAKGLDVRLHTPNGLHANLIDGELAALMKNSGFATIRLSVESASEKRLDDSCRKVSMDGFRAAISSLTGAGFASGEIEAYVMMGAPGQQADEVEQTMRIVHAEGAIIRLADFSPIPGTPYFDAARNAFNLDPDEPLRQNSSALPHIVPGLHDQYIALKKSAETLNSKLRAQGQNHAADL